MSQPPPIVIGVDIGGTFTDFVLLRDGQQIVHKRLSTPDDPARALLAGIEYLALSDKAVVIHGSTVATNALLERNGARTAFVTTQGFADLLEIGRQDRPGLYELVPQKPEPLVPPDLRYEVPERILADGAIQQALNQNAIDEIVRRILQADVESVSVSLLFSFVNDVHERSIGELLRQAGVSVSLSCELLPEYREYERASTTTINAYVMPVMSRYLARVEEGLQGHRLLVMQSSGGVITSETSRKEAARTALSGPAAGAIGAYYVAKQSGYDRIISFDMGGTSTDVALFDGHIPRTRDALIDGMPLRLPMVDIHTVGSGGGSIARVDSGGALRVGPGSAGSDPGPACYGIGEDPTTSDANLVLGRLQPEFFLGGEMRLDVDSAKNALSALAQDMGSATSELAALGVVKVANANMERAIRRVSVERGHDPRSFTLVAFGGAGPLHACELAKALRIPRVLIPPVPGVLSAFGMSVAELITDHATSVMATWDDRMPSTLKNAFADLERRGEDALQSQNINLASCRLERSLDMRYVGQSHEITVQETDQGWLHAFHTAHEALYGHRHDEALVEVINVRLRSIGIWQRPMRTMLAPRAGAAPKGVPGIIGYASIWFEASGPRKTALVRRELLHREDRLQGPALLLQLDTTTLIPPGWDGEVDPWGNVILQQ